MALRKKEKFRRILEQKLDRLLLETISSAKDKDIQFGSLADAVDRATSELEINIGLALRGRKSDRILQIREALKRLNNGTYGTCEVCGENIAVRRLEVRPEATLCIHCKTQQEII